MSVAFALAAKADLPSLQAAIASSPIVMPVFERPIAHWQTIRQSPEVDAFVLAWIASHVRRMPGGHAC